jgi:hypothetical protein
MVEVVDGRGGNWGGVWVPRAVTAIVLVSITVANGHRSFVTDADGLPNRRAALTPLRVTSDVIIAVIAIDIMQS